MTRRVVITLGAFLVMVACSTSQVLSTLRSIVVAAEVALPVIGPASGATPDTIAAIERYLVAVGKATAQASDILGGTGSNAEKSARIVQAFASVAGGCKCVGVGTPSRIVSVVEAVAQAVGNFLANFPRTEGVGATSVEIGPVSQGELEKIKQRSIAIVGAIEVKKP